jgi:hypothetical protein
MFGRSKVNMEEEISVARIKIAIVETMKTTIISSSDTVHLGLKRKSEK